MKKTTFWKALLCLSLTGCILSICFAAYRLYEDYAAENVYQKAREQTEKETAPETEVPETETIPQETAYTQEFTGEREGEEAKIPEDVFLDMENPIDFGRLAGENPDIYAWIRIPETNIDYPIAQREGDPAFYLDHDMYGEARFAGCIYTEDSNSRDFLDPNTVIYGHNMKNGSMFQNLHLFADSSFFEEHPYFYIYTPERVLVYQVFAAYVYDDRHLMNSFDFDDKEVFARYLEDVFHVKSMGANIREDLSVTEEDRIVTLSTCVGGAPESRYLVQAVLVKDEKSNE